MKTGIFVAAMSFAAVSFAAEDLKVETHVEAVGFYTQNLDGDPKKNRGIGEDTINLIFSGQPAENAVLTVDIEAQGATQSFGLSEAHLELSGLFQDRVTVTGGWIDLTSWFDASDYANDENSQFIRGEFVNNPVLANPNNGVGAAAVLKVTGSMEALLGFQNENGNGADVFDLPYVVGGLSLAWGMGGGGALRLWSRYSARGTDAEIHASGLVLDQALPMNLGLVVRAAREWPWFNSDSGAYHNTGAGGEGFSFISAGLQSTFESYGQAGLIGGTNRNDIGSSSDSAEIYYRYDVNENFTISLHGGTDFSRMQLAVAQNDGSTNYAAIPSQEKIMARIYLYH